MGQGRGKHTKVVKKNPNYTPPVKTNISKHPKVYRQTPNYTTTVNKQGLSTTQGIHGAAYGVHKNQQDRIRQQQFRTATVNVVHKVRHVTGNVAQPVTNLAQIIGNRNQNTLHLTDKGRMITNQEANQRGQIQHGSGVVQKGDKKFDKKKLIRPKGAGEHPVYMNPFGL